MTPHDGLAPAAGTTDSHVRTARASVPVVLTALATGGFAIGLTEFASMSILPDFARGLGVDETTAGHAISAYALGVVVGAPVLAVLGAKAPRWLLLIAFMAVFAAGNILSAFSPTFEWMLVFRFLSGLPHGAYFGVAALVAASIVPIEIRTRAVSTILVGLTVATIVGVPAATAMSHIAGWRWTYVAVAILAALTMTLVWMFAPRDPPHPGATIQRELGALSKPQVWLTVGVGAIGFGGMFSVYAYLASTLTAVTGVGPEVLPWVFAVFGAGLFIGNILGGWLADKHGFASAGALLVIGAVMLATYPFAASNVWAVSASVLLIGSTIGGLASILQTRLMDVAGEAQTLAAALNHSAFNFANALGPFLGGLAVAAGYGWRSTGWVGVGLALAGFAIWALAAWTGRSKAA
jgi:DHA1 family inner membrane transport protein